MNTAPGRFRRRDTSSERPGLLFWAYDGKKEIWCTPDQFEMRRIASLTRTIKYMSKRKENWTNHIPQHLHRGYVSEDHPGLIFWGYWHFGMERWVTPEKSEYLRVQKNKGALRFTRSEASKIKESINAKARHARKTPEEKAVLAKKQRDKRSIYSPRQKQWRTNYKKKRRAADPLFRLRENLGTRIRLGFKRQCARKQTKMIDLIGCSFDFFKKWIEEQFEPGMSFDNYSFDTWHIDHIVPIGLFDLSDPEAQGFAFNWRNCRPAWGKPNLSKNVRLDMDLVDKYFLHEWLRRTKIVQLETQAA